MTSLTALALLGSLVAGGSPLYAESEPPASVTWSVAPASADGEDGRAWVEQEADPGETFTDHLAVTNFSDATVTFRLSAADGYFTENGRFNMLQSNEPSVAAGTWITVQDTVTVGADETVVVPYEVTVPNNATPGDTAAGIAASVLTQTTADGGAAVGVESRVGFRIMMRVSGELAPALGITGLRGDYHLDWNPFSPGAATVTFTAENTGNARLRVTPVASIVGRFDDVTGTDLELLPGDARTVTVPVSNVWPLLFGTASVNLPAEVVGEGGRDLSATASTFVWTPPLSQLLALLGVVLIVGAVAYGRRRRREQIDAMLADARAEGARAAHSDARRGGVS